jgi:hypothetical protein
MGEKRTRYRLQVGKPDGKRPQGRPRCGWVDIMKLKPVEIGWGDVECIGLAQDKDKWRALVNLVMNFKVL